MPTRKLQNPDDFRGQKFYVGIDVHKKSWSVTVRSLNFVVAHFTQPPSPEALLSQLQHKFPGGEYYSTYEAGFSGTGAHEKLCKLGIKNIVVHPGDIPRTDKEKKNKTDVHGSRSLAFNLEKRQPAFDFRNVQATAGVQGPVPFAGIEGKGCNQVD